MTEYMPDGLTMAGVKLRLGKSLRNDGKYNYDMRFKIISSGAKSKKYDFLYQLWKICRKTIHGNN